MGGDQSCEISAEKALGEKKAVLKFAGWHFYCSVVSLRWQQREKVMTGVCDLSGW